MKRFFPVLALAFALAAPSYSTPASAADQAEGKTLVVATNATFPPLEFVDINKQIVGYDMDIIQAIGEEAGFKVKFLNTSWDGIFATLDSNNCDIIAAGVTITPEREKRYLFSEPYYKMQQAVVVPVNSSITKVEDLAGKRVGAQIGTTGVFFLQREAPQAQIASYDDVGLAFEDLKNGRLDAVACDDPVASYYANRKEGYDGTMKVSFVSQAGEAMGFVLRPADKELAGQINKGLAAIRANGKEKAIQIKWFGE